MPLSPAAAARIADVSRTTIMRAIRDGSLPAATDNQTRLNRIERTDLDAWMASRTTRAPADPAPLPAAAAEPVTSHDESPELVSLRTEVLDLRSQVARLEGAAEAAAERLRDAQERRDEWKAMADKLADRDRSQPRHGFLARLFGR